MSRAIRLGFLSEAIPHQYKTVNGESIIDFFEKIKAQYASSHAILGNVRSKK
jgi:hypothetical protein